ncbi:hypothetical protein AB6A40_008536 [Gnathostoma spinigerum]|uniref:Gamma-secretase subunit PEN-2 n=1 Tax=Gnathostoma spinigerum TaxID=75299 RepID=A0ABD6EYP7_9BILA
MDLSRISEADRLKLCRQYFLIGIALLPFVWVVNVVCFFNYAFIAKPFPTQNQIRKYTLLSILGSLLWIFIVAGWQVFFQIERAKGYEWTDRISFTFPMGYV